MSLCINPHCLRPQNPKNILFCQACGSELLLEGQYRVIRQLGEGGFGKTLEVSQNNTLKVLKVLILDDAKAVSLFQQEARVLSQLNHPGIPKAYKYFTFLPKNSHSPLHCLVMEKIEGLDLQKYLEQRGNHPIDEKIALLWLTQLANILHEVHQQNFFHRDIKPSNIMLKADGHLALIDFGTAREITQSYHHKAAGQKVTGIISPGYTPPEQLNGKAVPQSDFFALGRTFVYLLTGKSPDVFAEDPRTGKLIWRNSATQVSKQVAGLIDYLMEQFPGKRPQNAKMILQCISEIDSTLQSNSSSVSASPVPPTEIQIPRNSKQSQKSATTQTSSSKTHKNSWRSAKIAEFIATVIAFLIFILLKFGSRLIFKPFDSQPSQPVVASTPHQIETANSEYKDNSSEQLKNDLDRQAPPTPTESTPSTIENTPPVIPPGWKKFQGGGAELWLPESYLIIDKKNLNNLVKRLKTLGPKGNLSAQFLQVGYSQSRIWAFDSTTGNSGFPTTNLTVINEQVSLEYNIETYLKEISKGLRIVDLKTGLAENSQVEVGQIIVLGINSKQIHYVFKNKNTIWHVMFSTSQEEFEQRLPIFEASILTFSVKH